MNSENYLSKPIFKRLLKMNDLLNESEKETQLKYWAKSDVCKNEAVSFHLIKYKVIIICTHFRY